MCSKPISANFLAAYRLLLQASFVHSSNPHAPPPLLLLPSAFIWAIKPIPQWLCAVAPVGISPCGKRWFSSSPPSLPCPHSGRSAKPSLSHRSTSRSSGHAKKNVLEARRKNNMVKNPPEEGNIKSFYAFTAAVSLFSSSAVYSAKLRLMTNCIG